VKGIYDRETDTLTLILREARIEESDEVRPGIIFDYDADGAVVSVEILDASRNVSEPLSFAYEVKEQAVAG